MKRKIDKMSIQDLLKGLNAEEILESPSKKTRINVDENKNESLSPEKKMNNTILPSSPSPQKKIGVITKTRIAK